MLDGIAFLPAADVTTGLSWLKSIVPEDGRSLLQCFAETHVVEGVSRPVGSSGQRDFHFSVFTVNHKAIDRRQEVLMAVQSADDRLVYSPCLLL